MSSGRRILVVGTSGAGKTYVAQHLAKRLNLRYICNDTIIWGPDWTPVPKADRLPHPDNMNVDVIQVTETKVSKARMPTFAMALFIKPPTPKFRYQTTTSNGGRGKKAAKPWKIRNSNIGFKYSS